MKRTPLAILVYKTGHTRAEIAEALGIDNQKATRVINGRHILPACFVQPLAQFLGVSVADILAAVTTDADTLRGRTRKPRPTATLQEQPDNA
jgi:transcriptional regulator with XRE-family HTH domain